MLDRRSRLQYQLTFNRKGPIQRYTQSTLRNQRGRALSPPFDEGATVLLLHALYKRGTSISLFDAGARGEYRTTWMWQDIHVRQLTRNKLCKVHVTTTISSERECIDSHDHRDSRILRPSARTVTSRPYLSLPETPDLAVRSHLVAAWKRLEN